MVSGRAGGYKGIAHMALQNFVHRSHRAANRMEGGIHCMRHHGRVRIQLHISALRRSLQQSLKIGLRMHAGNLLRSGFGGKVAGKSLKFFGFQCPFYGSDPVWTFGMVISHIM